MRLLAAALTLALLAAACSTSVPPVGVDSVSSGMDVRAAVVAATPAESADDLAPIGEERSGAEETSSEDDADGDDGEMIATLRAGPLLAPLEARDVRWSLRLAAVRFDHAPSDLIRPPIRA